MNFPFVTLLIYTININLKYTNARAILPRDYSSSSPLSPASYDKEDGMNENLNRLNLGPTFSVRPSKDAENLDSIPSLDADKEQQSQRKSIVLSSSLNFSIRVEDASKDHNTILIPIGTPCYCFYLFSRILNDDRGTKF
ncbi:hypothetical protein PGT21_024513 [Puccinia graminis f. sp. tritici]|uniref:Uncharacterized protein n=1 Tax=Puccinia graminis f. sp. tritici TaxID=56615 RepID=A0A5B0QJ48_PUCGR|nr:hypothetical protein PGT21_024513 [Puccinia graminis f. sp. tritici]